jgi:hypothetical protein
MAKEIIKAKSVFIYKDGVAIGCATDVSINVDVDTVEASCKDSEGWTESVPGDKSWTADISAIKRIFTDPDDDTNVSSTQIFDSIVDGDTLVLAFGTGVTGHTRYTGTAWVNNWGESAGNSGAATWSASFKGTGPLSKATVV